MREFRTVLNITGVTHPVEYYPTHFINETLFSLLERMGLYAGIVLKRYGFHGTGGGRVEARVYPRGNLVPVDLTMQERIELRRARIIFSGPAIGFAEKMKSLIKSDLGLDVNAISIIEVLDCDGMGISALLYLDSLNGLFPSPVQYIIPYGAEVYNSFGDLVFDEGESLEKLKEKIEYAKLSMDRNIVPEQVFREAALYMYLAGVREIKGHYRGEYGECVGDYGLFDI